MLNTLGYKILFAGVVERIWSLNKLFNYLVGSPLIVALIVLVSSNPLQARTIDVSTHAQMMAQKAHGLIKVRKTQGLSSGVKQERRANQGGALTSSVVPVQCGAISIGNIKTDPSDHRRHVTHIYINGDITNANNKC